MIDFGLPLFLLLALLVLPLLAGASAWGAWQRRRAAARYAGSGLALLRSGRVSAARRRLKTALVLLAAALLVLAVARPQHGRQQVVLPRAGSDVVVAMDVSRSMGVQDVQPSRLDHAKQAATALIDHLAGNRVALVVFAGSAVVDFPLTTDLQAARQVTDSLGILDSGVKGGTDLAAAINTAGRVLKGDQTRGKVIVIISDGEDLAGNDLQAAARAAGDGLIIETVGVGTQNGGQVIAVDPRTKKATPVIDPDTGRTAISHRNDGNLRQLAAAGHGASYDGNSKDFAFDLSGAIDRLQPTRFQSGVATIPFEYFQVPLALALVLLILDTFLVDSFSIDRLIENESTKGARRERAERVRRGARGVGPAAAGAATPRPAREPAQTVG